MAAGLAAQRPVFTVGGANPSFASLPMAVAAAAPGAVIIVRPGNHTGFVTNKPLRIILDFTFQTGLVSAPAGSAYAIEVNGLPAGTDFAIVGRGARINGGTIGAIRVANCGGRVAIDGVEASLGNTKVGLDVQNAATVAVQHCRFWGRHGLQAQDAVVSMIGTSCSSAVSFGLVALRGTLDLALGSYVGNAAPGIRVTDSTVHLAGDGTTPIRVAGTPTVPVSAFESINSDVQWDGSRFVMTPKNGAPGFAMVGGVVVTDELPALVATGGAPGAVMTATMTRPTPAAGLIALGNLTVSHPVFGLSGIYLDEFRPLLAIAVGTVDANGLTRQASWPNVPWLLGEVFCCQGFVAPAGGGLLRSAPGIWAAM